MLLKAGLFNHTENGVAAVEFALLLPVLILLIFGIIDGGILLFHWVMVTGEVNDMARWASVHYTPTCGPFCCNGGNLYGPHASMVYNEKLAALFGRGSFWRPRATSWCVVSYGVITASITDNVPFATPLIPSLLPKLSVINATVSVLPER
jgi:hypothetical protein